MVRLAKLHLVSMPSVSLTSPHTLRQPGVGGREPKQAGYMVGVGGSRARGGGSGGGGGKGRVSGPEASSAARPLRR